MVDILKGKGVIAIACKFTAQGIESGLVVINSSDRTAIISNPDNLEEKYSIQLPGQGTFYKVVLAFARG